MASTRHKARIVALGYQQRKDVDYFASFSPTASYVTIRLVLALTALPRWYGVDLDATGAFISAPLPPEEQVYLKGIPGFDLPKGKCLRLEKTIYGLVQAPLSYFKLCKEVHGKIGLRQLDCDECVFVRCAQNIKGQPPLTTEHIIESGAFMTMDTVPEHQRVYKSCVYQVACVIVVMYVDNNGVRHNCWELLAEFEADVAKDGRIDLHREGDMSSFLSVRYINNTQTGEITADQEAYIDTLLAKYQMTNCNPNKVPLKPSVNLHEIAARLPLTPHPEIVSLYAQLIGELMFIGSFHDKCELGALCAGQRRIALSQRRQVSENRLVCCSREISFCAVRNLRLFRCKLGRRRAATQKLSKLFDILQQRSVQLEIFFVLCTCDVLCRS